MRYAALAAILALWPGPCRAGHGAVEPAEPAPEFQVSSLPELPTATTPVTAGAWNTPRAELPTEAGRTEGFNFNSVDEAALREYAAVARFEAGDAPPQEKAARWRGLGHAADALAGACENRASQWENYAAQQALDAVLEKENSGAAADEKRAAWLKLAKSFPKYERTAQEQAQQWQRYTVELAAVAAVKRQRAKIRDRDWARLSKLFSLPTAGEEVKKAFAVDFIRAYGKTADDNPYLTDLLPLLPKEMLSPEEAGALAAITWVTIAGGRFVMGATDLGASSLPRRRVTLKTFLLARTLVTNKQYQACVQAGACTPPADCDEKFKGDDQPVVCVDWGQAQAFALWAGGRLPTEAEWEYAARGRGQERKYPWGDQEPDCRLAVLNDARWPQASRPGCGKAATWPVCSKPKGDTQQGLCDMAGNAWQWVQDWYHDSYNEAPKDGSAWESPAGSERVIRGGAWNYSATAPRSAGRSSRAPEKRTNDLGIRLAQSISL